MSDAGRPRTAWKGRGGPLRSLVGLVLVAIASAVMLTLSGGFIAYSLGGLLIGLAFVATALVAANLSWKKGRGGYG